MNVYSVDFLDRKDGLPNHKLLQAQSEGEVRAYMEDLGHTIVKIKEV